MDPRALNEKLRKEILAGLVGQDREKVLAEIEARENFISSVERGAEVRCSCGLIMPRVSFYEHLKETKHEETRLIEKLETCSCGLIMSVSNLREHSMETGHTPIPQPFKQDRRPQRIPGTKPAGIKLALNFQFEKPDDMTEP